MERPEREEEEEEEEEKPRLLVDALGFQPDDIVANVRAGTGYYTFRLATRVPRGTVRAWKGATHFASAERREG